MQELAAFALVALSLAYWARSLLRPAAGGCASGCGACPSAKTAAPVAKSATEAGRISLL